MTTALTAFTTTHRVIMRVHNDATVVGTTAEPTATTCLTRRLQSVIAVAYTTDCSLAGAQDLARLARREFDDAIATFTGSQLGEIACGTNQQSALTRTELDVVNNRTDRNVLQAFGVLFLGPAIATKRFFDTLNKIERVMNEESC